MGKSKGVAVSSSIEFLCAERDQNRVMLLELAQSTTQTVNTALSSLRSTRGREPSWDGDRCCSSSVVVPEVNHQHQGGHTQGTKEHAVLATLRNDRTP